MTRGNHDKKDPGDLTPKGVSRAANNILTQHLKTLGNESYTVDDEGDSITRFQTLAKLVWDKALGHTEKVVLDGGETVETVHKPDKSYISLIFDRTEGRVATAAISDGKKKESLAARIGKQATARLNRLIENNG